MFKTSAQRFEYAYDTKLSFKLNICESMGRYETLMTYCVRMKLYK